MVYIYISNNYNANPGEWPRQVTKICRFPENVGPAEI
jgi:hypothetical protein